MLLCARSGCRRSESGDVGVWSKSLAKESIVESIGSKTELPAEK